MIHSTGILIGYNTLSAIKAEREKRETLYKLEGGSTNKQSIPIYNCKDENY